MTTQNDSPGKYLKERYNCKLFQSGFPVGVEVTDKFMNALKEVSGKPVPENSPGWNGRPIGELASYIDKAPAKRELLDGSWITIRDSLAAMNVKLSTNDLATIRRIHSDFFRDGINLTTEIPLSISQAALGARVVVPTAEGEEEIEIKAGTQPNDVLRLKGRGAPNVRRPSQRGDLLIHIAIEVPKKLSGDQRKALEAFAKASGEENH
jgi:hypothetical protein